MGSSETGFINVSAHICRLRFFYFVSVSIGNQMRATILLHY